MHINFKYFIVSIGAIFLALGVGILIGTSMGSSVDIQEQNAAIVTDIDKQFKQLKEKDDKLTETNKNLLAKIDNIKDFIAENESLLSDQKLSGKKLALISFNEKANVDSVKNAPTNAGASIELDIQIKDEVLNTTNLEKINTKLSQKFTKKEEVISYIANAIKNVLKGLLKIERIPILCITLKFLIKPNEKLLLTFGVAARIASAACIFAIPPTPKITATKLARAAIKNPFNFVETGSI